MRKYSRLYRQRFRSVSSLFPDSSLSRLRHRPLFCSSGGFSRSLVSSIARSSKQRRFLETLGKKKSVQTTRNVTKSNWSQFFFFPLRSVHAWLPFFRAFSRTLFLEVLATVPFVPGTFAFFFLFEPLFAPPSERAFAFRYFLFLPELQYYGERERERAIYMYLSW